MDGLTINPPERPWPLEAEARDRQITPIVDTATVDETTPLVIRFR